ncbi:MAG TPA: SUMF1/EgtB/PvdO family nonheme iron enzyme [Candidatus Angelobacter sp.]|jgi:formylglycine-generating enzyme required for sulfatase activity|nr:SUMF1/EgtB/PvdO family nonheme iron enzyme [Candidatus Angelobacter sp.]
MPAVKQEPRYDVFISYRRGGAYDLALLLQTKLQQLGVNAFLDRDLRRGVFDETLLRTIEESTTFLIILTPNALERCSDPEDWLRKEIVQAIQSGRNIIPLTDSFQFTPEVVKNLDPAIRELPRYQAVVCSRDYLDSTLERIVKIVKEDKAERAEKDRLAILTAEAEKKEQEQREAQQQARERAQRIREHRQLIVERSPERLRPALAMLPAPPTRQLSRLPKRLWATGMVAVVGAIIAFVGYAGWKTVGSSRSPGNPLSQPTPTTTPHDPVPSLESAIAGTVKVNLKDGLKYVWIPPGTFQMGCSAGDAECFSDERPAHSVTINKGFWLGQTPVTQAAYQQVIGSNPSHFRGEQLPVETVTWNQAKAYCEAIGGRLPTEAEWEYATRAGNDSSRYGDLHEIAWYSSNSNSKTHDVGLKRANQWGLYDMLGNVWQWVGDWYDEKYYSKSPPVDPTGPTSGQNRVLRGGSCFDLSRNLRSSNRNRFEPLYRDYFIGFRCVREVFP